jgi:hypothetical protein
MGAERMNHERDEKDERDGRDQRRTLNIEQ